MILFVRIAVSLFALWFWAGAITAPFIINVGPWWPASLILGGFAAGLSAIAAWIWTVEL